MQRLELTFPVPQTAGIPLWSACRWWLPSCKCVRFLRLMRVLWGEAFEASGRRDRSAIKHLVWRSFSISEKWKWNEEKRIDLSVAACNWLLSSIHSPCYHGSRILLLSSHAHTHEAMQTVKHTHTPSVCITLLLHSSLHILYEEMAKIAILNSLGWNEAYGTSLNLHSVKVLSFKRKHCSVGFYILGWPVIAYCY